MGVPNLTSYKPSPGDDVDANQITNLIAALEDILGNIGDTALMTWEAGQIIDLDQLKQSGASANQVPMWDSGSGEWVPTTITDVNTFYSKTSETDVANTTTKTDLFGSGLTIGAGKLGATGDIEVFASGDYLFNGSVSRTIALEFKLGSEVLWDSGASDSIVTASSRRAWWFSAVILAAGSTSAQVGGGFFAIGDTNPATTGTGVIHGLDGNGKMGAPFTNDPSTVDMLSAQTLKLSVTHSGSTSCSMKCKWARVKVYR